jgi:hypothetical protein
VKGGDLVHSSAQVPFCDLLKVGVHYGVVAPLLFCLVGCCPEVSCVVFAVILGFHCSEVLSSLGAVIVPPRCSFWVEGASWLHGGCSGKLYGIMD